MRFRFPAALLLLLSVAIIFIPSAAQAFSLGLEPVSGSVGTEVKIPAFCQYGQGDYYLYWGDSNQLIAQGTVDSKGCTPIYFKVPQSPKGNFPVTLKVGDKSFSRDFTVTSTIELAKRTGLAGSAVTVYGYGFEKEEKGISITFDGNTVASNIEANHSGSWQYTLKIPVSARGEHPISASGQNTTTQETGNKSFEVTPSITVNPVTGWVGRAVSISGTGFGSGESSITVLYDGVTVKSNLTADSFGTWQSSFSIPISAKGSHRLDARGNMTTTEEVPDISISISPGIRVEQTSGKLGEVIHVGDTLVVSGIGFQSDESDIEVTFDGLALVENIPADSQGSWSAQFVVPPTYEGDHLVEASGETTRSDDVTPCTIVITPHLEVNPDNGAVGTSVVLSGNGFSSNQPITIAYDNNNISSEASTDFKGNINTSFRVPASKAGVHAITVSDAGGATGTVQITVESTPPQAPSPISPEKGAIFKLLENRPVEFRWSTVDDPSGVEYTFELSERPGFANHVLRRENLEEPSITLQINERPVSGQYYWRVRAVDLAGNTSGWSEARPIEFSGSELLWWGGIAFGILILAGFIVWRIRVISKKGGWSSDTDSDS